MEIKDTLQAETAVIGSILQDETILPTLLASVKPGDFLSSDNRLIFQAVRDLFRHGEPVDAVTIAGRIGEKYAPMLLQAINLTPSARNWASYARLMREQTSLAKLKDAAEGILSAVTPEDCRELITRMTDVLNERQDDRVFSMAKMMEEFVAQQQAGPDSTRYFSYGLPELDSGTYTRPGNFVLLAGRPSDGKTALALQMAYTMAADHKVGFFSLETDHEDLMNRLAAYRLRIDFGRINKRSMNTDDWQVFTAAAPEMSTRSLHVFESSGMTAAEIESVSEAYGLEVIFVDYLQIVIPETSRGATRTEEVSGISRALHTFAQRTKTLVVGLCQLNRASTAGGKWRKPDLPDLRESGQLEQDADLIMFLYRPKPGTEFDADSHRMLAVAKNKTGRLGDFPLHWDGQHQTFTNLTKEEIRSLSGKKIVRDLIDNGKAIKARRDAEAAQLRMTELPSSTPIPFEEATQ